MMVWFLFSVPLFAFSGYKSVLCEQGRRFDALRVDRLEVQLHDKATVSIFEDKQLLGEALFSDGEVVSLPSTKGEVLPVSRWFKVRDKKVYIKVKKMIRQVRKHRKKTDVLIYIDANKPSLGGCSIGTDANDVWVSKAEFVALKKEVAALKQALQPRRRTPTRAVNVKEQQARKQLDVIHRYISQNKVDEARNAMVDMQKQYANTSTWRKAQRVKSELSVFGKGSPAYMGIKDWLQGKPTGRFSLSNGLVLLVFTETWCRYCIREMPKLEKLFQQYKKQGLQVVGVTKLSRSGTKKKMLDLLQKQKITYPFLQEDGALSQYFKVTGIPAAAVIKNGVIIWRGHPARLQTQQIKSWF